MPISRIETAIRHTRDFGRRAINCAGYWIIEQTGPSLRARCSLCGEGRPYIGRSFTDAQHQLAAESRVETG
jgi:hypothetical protein